ASWKVSAETPLEIAVCSSPGSQDRPPRVIGPDSHSVMTRGKGNNVRYVTDIINETDPADSLLVVEVITPAGNASSYPPHKHDRDAFPAETRLEEVYYHRLNPPQGFGFQRIYTDDRSLDVSMTIEDGDVTLVPRGYHPCAALHGYDLYYLNVMAGPRRQWRFFNDAARERRDPALPAEAGRARDLPGPSRGAVLGEEGRRRLVHPERRLRPGR